MTCAILRLWDHFGKTHDGCDETEECNASWCCVLGGTDCHGCHGVMCDRCVAISSLDLDDTCFSWALLDVLFMLTKVCRALLGDTWCFGASGEEGRGEDIDNYRYLEGSSYCGGPLENVKVWRCMCGSGEGEREEGRRSFRHFSSSWFCTDVKLCNCKK